MQYTFLQAILLVFAVLFLVMLAKRLNVAYPIVLVLGGLLMSFYPGGRVLSIEPEQIFIIFLPPLLYEAAWYTSWKEFWRWRRVITSFAFLIVILTSLVVALVSSAIIPGFSLALGFLLGGIVSPPDAVSATSVLKNVKVPKRLAAILEGESLLNDASSLIVFRFALIAVDTGRFVFYEAAWSFALVIVMGIATGIAIALVYYAIHKWLPTSTNMDIVLTLTAPYVMYLVAEMFHFSGVLAVVSGGLFLAARSHQILSHRSRIQGSNVWSTLGFVLNGLVFMLIGLQLPVISAQLGSVSMSTAILYGVLITVVLTIARVLSTLGASAFTVFISRFITTADSRPGWKGPLIFGWAGMRGVVSLAAAMSIPFYLSDGTAFPQRNLILFITFVVILLTLVVQGLTLPWVIRKVNMADPDNHKPLEEQDCEMRKLLAHHAMQFLQQQDPAVIHSNKGFQDLKSKYEREQLVADPLIDQQQEEFRVFYLELLERQRDYLHELNKDPEMDEDIIRKYQGLMDLEEEKIRIRYNDQLAD
jgi:monovalent cation/hydrogen antiporter